MVVPPKVAKVAKASKEGVISKALSRYTLPMETGLFKKIKLIFSKMDLSFIRQLQI